MTPRQTLLASVLFLFGCTSPTGGDSGVDAGQADAGSVITTNFNDLVDRTKWGVFDLLPVDANARVFQGSAFDGRYLYLAPITNGLIARFDTQGPFTAASWSVFNMRTLYNQASSYVGAVFDGRFVHFVPFEHGRVARYDTQQGLTEPSAWSFFDLTTLDPRARGYFGGAFDGRFLYLSPFRRDGASHGLAARFDTRASLETPSAWTLFDLASLDAGLIGFDGAAFDGRYVYFTPYNQRSVARFDSTVHFGENAAFDRAASWSWFDVSTLEPRCVAFQGSIFDGRFLYLLPWNGGNGSVLARLDTLGSFGQPDSWATFDMKQVDQRAAGFVGGQFDGRFIYFAPYGNGMSGLVVRFDTTVGLRDLSGWAKFDLASISPRAVGFGGGGFDGRFVYFVPEETGVVARFDSKSPASLPPLLGSFQ